HRKATLTPCPAHSDSLSTLPKLVIVLTNTLYPTPKSATYLICITFQKAQKNRQQPVFFNCK
ncbi:MAG: hypothetical protein OIF55_09910, partial [Amphritea sp.]|nr:hypothetical protein [Amphritea sp.]